MIALSADFVANESVYLLAVSDDNDPNGSWAGWSLDATVDGATATNNWADYEKVGYDDSFAIYITSNQFNFGSPSSFQYSKIRVIRKSEAYWSGTPGALTWFDFVNMQNEDTTTAFTIQPCNTLSSSAYQYLVNSESWASGDGITLWRIEKTWNPTLTRVGTVAVSSYTIPPNAEQLGGVDRIDTGDNRLYNAVYRDGKIYTGFPEAYDWGSGANCNIRLVGIDVAGVSAAWDYTYGLNGYYYYYPAISIDTGNNNHVVFSRSGSSEYAGIRYTGRQSGDTPLESSELLMAGQGYYVNYDGSGRNRWGDYNGIGIDPTVWGTSWIYSEYATDSNTWGTRIGEVSYEPYAMGTSIPEVFSAIPKDFTFTVRDFDWVFVGINPTTDHDVYIDDTFDFSSPLASSTETGTTRDFVAVNGHTYGDATHYARVTYGTSSDYTIEVEWWNPNLTLNTPASYSALDYEVLDCYSIDLAAGTEYTLDLDVTTGTADLNVWIYGPDRDEGSRTDYDWTAQTANPGGDESITFTPTTSGEHAIVVVNENAQTSNFTITVSTTTTVAVTVTSSPPGLEVIVDSTPYTAPQVFDWLPGSSHTIGVSSPQSAGAGTQYAYNSWSDAGDQTHTIVTPAFDTTYTASFDLEYSLTTAANPGAGGTVGPSGVTWHISGAPVDVTATNNTGYVFSNWTGDVPAGDETDNPVSITMDSPKSLTANFSLTVHTLTVQVAPPGGGAVAKDPDQPSYAYGETVDLTATPSDGYLFSEWEGDVPSGDETDNPLTITMDGDKTLTAKFAVMWQVITAANPEQLVGLDTNGDGNKEVVVDFGALGLWIWQESAWSQLTKKDPEYMVALDYDDDGLDELALDFGGDGIWLWDITWNKLSPDSAESMIAGDIVSGGGDELVVHFGSMGIWRWNGAWTRMTGDNPEHMIAADVDGDTQDEVVVDFGASIGFWRWDGAWVKMTGDSPEYFIAADIDGGGDQELIVDFGASIGFWRWDGAWTKMTGDDAENMIAADTDGDGNDDLIVDFGTGLGLWRWSGGWSPLTGDTPEDMIAADVDNDGNQEVISDFGSIGLWMWNGAWFKLSEDDAEDMIGADSDGDGGQELYVDFASLGLWMW
jgi:hypothetical protein